jgi:hypothetical protein
MSLKGFPLDSIICLSIKFPNMVELAELLFYNKVMERIANYDMQ